MASALYTEMARFARRPQPFAISTIADLWTDAHISRQMLAFHLDPDIDAASRRRTTIESFVDWLDHRLGLAGRKVTDLGCGPGLYAEAIAARGGRVTGIDFSRTSLAHARASAARGGWSRSWQAIDASGPHLQSPMRLAAIFTDIVVPCAVVMFIVPVVVSPSNTFSP